MTIFREDAPRMTAADVRAAALPLTPWGRRGYNAEIVDALLDAAARELEMCAAEAAGLREEVMRMRQKAADILRGKGVDWLADAGEAHAMARAMISEAQVTVDRYVADAREYAGRLTGDAAERREAMLAEAEQVLADARAQARAAADAALDEPVPASPAGPLRATRAQAAYDGTFSGVYLRHMSLTAENIQQMVNTLQRMLADALEQASGGQPGEVPAPAGRDG
jgi:cell division initiation protein